MFKVVDILPTITIRAARVKSNACLLLVGRFGWSHLPK